MIRILHDTPEGYPFIAERMTLPCVRHYSPVMSRKYLTWLAGAWKVMRASKKGDIIVSVYDFQGVLCYWIGLLTMRQRKILGINLLLKEKSSLRNRVARFLYRRALKSRWFQTTVSTADYGNRMVRYLRLDRRLPLLRDVFYDSYLTEAEAMPHSDGGYVFSGGRNGRDWNFLLKVAAGLPHIKFRLAMPATVLAGMKERQTPISPNVECQCDLSMHEFNALIAGSSLVALPLDTESPAGLIVVFQAAAHNKPIIITDTVSTHDYVSDGKGFPIKNDTDTWQHTIQHIFSHPQEAAHSARQLAAFITTHCSEARYVARIEEIIRDL